MPYPSQVSQEIIIAQAWQLIEAEGVENLSLAKLAGKLGIKAPSLYRHMGNKAGLLRAVNFHTSQQLVADLNRTAANVNGNAQEKIAAILHSYRAFALSHPHTYVLAFTNTEDTLRPDEEAMEQLVLPIQQLMTAVSGQAKSLAALRGAMALAHGFVMLELNGQLRRGGDLGADFATAVHAYLNGW